MKQKPVFWQVILSNLFIFMLLERTAHAGTEDFTTINLTGILLLIFLVLGWALGIVVVYRKISKKDQLVSDKAEKTPDTILAAEQNLLHNQIKTDKVIDGYINNIKNTRTRRLCRRAKEKIENMGTDIKLDVSLGYLRFSVGGQRIASIYADRDFFWLDTGPDKWKGQKVINEETLNAGLKDVEATLIQLSGGAIKNIANSAETERD